MKRAGKRIIKVIALVLALVIVGCGCFGGYVLYRLNCDKSGGEYDYSAVFTAPAYSFDAGDDGEFDVIKINDTHFINGTCENDRRTLSELKSQLDKTDFDFIVVNGDLIDGFNFRTDYDKYGALDTFIGFIESYSTPWTFCPGNNDGELDGDNEAVIAYLMKGDNFIYGNKEGIYGSMEFFADITYKGSVVHTLAFLDSGMRKPKAFGEYDYIHESQIQYLLDGVNERKVPASVFFHMPSPDFEKAYESGEEYGGFLKCKYFPYDSIEKNSLFDDMIKDNEYISLLSCGHQHSNNMCSFYGGRWYQLSSCNGYSAVNTLTDVAGATLTRIYVNAPDAKTMYDFEQIAA